MLQMKAWPLLVVLGCIYLTYSLEEGKDLKPVKWTGGLTKMDDGRKVNNGISTRAQLHDDFAFLCNPRYSFFNNSSSNSSSCDFLLRKYDEFAPK